MINPVALKVFGFEIYWYGIIIATGVIVGILLALREAKRRGYSSEVVLDICLLAIPASIIGARAYYVAFEWNTFKDNIWSIFNPRTGGMAIYGAVIASILVLILYCKRKKLSFWALCDVFIPSLVLGQAIGRWGNFVNQEAFGFAVTNPSLQWFPFAVPIVEGMVTWHLATFFYESMWDLLIFLFLWFYLRKAARRRGTVTLSYFALYGIGRAFIEVLRTDSLAIVKIPQGVSFFELIARGEASIGQIPISALLSLALALVAVIILLMRRRGSDPEPSDIEAPVIPEGMEVDAAAALDAAAIADETSPAQNETLSQEQAEAQEQNETPAVEQDEAPQQDVPVGDASDEEKE
nr:prolipoprotein diacylglyceryl transferase [Maliibacterium massiliense]